VSSALEVVNQVCGTTYTYEDVTSWEILDLVKDPGLKPLVKAAFNRAGFCSSLKPYPGDLEAFPQIEAVADVYYVTSPLKSNPYWMHERTQWLISVCGAKPNQVNFVSDKFIVSGDIFLDDAAGNVNAWALAHPGKAALLWSRPWNAGAALESGVTRVSSWAEVISHVSRRILMVRIPPSPWGTKSG
jgi:5'(3')-deoxyribonucleotidase